VGRLFLSQEMNRIPVRIYYRYVKVESLASTLAKSRD
jgi:oligoribonuclease (3'-5' exoribonuclease)